MAYVERDTLEMRLRMQRDALWVMLERLSKNDSPSESERVMTAILLDSMREEVQLDIKEISQ